MDLIDAPHYSDLVIQQIFSNQDLVSWFTLKEVRYNIYSRQTAKHLSVATLARENATSYRRIDDIEEGLSGALENKINEIIYLCMPCASVEEIRPLAELSRQKVLLFDAKAIIISTSTRTKTYK